MVDGVHFGEHTCVVALGIDIDGTKRPLALVEGSTKNATPVTELIVGLRERGWTSPARSWSCSTNRRRCAARWWTCSTGRVIGRCQLHKIRNVQDRLPEKMRSMVTARIRRA